MHKSWDYLIVGGGVVGFNIGIEILKRKPASKVLLIEKEGSAGQHASGRNSGVVHAGFYYSPDSIKAKLTRDGNFLLREFAAARKLKIRPTGKVVVAQVPDDLEKISQLYERGIANNVAVEIVDEKKVLELEPKAKTFREALWSPNTAVGDPIEFMKAFEAEFLELGGQVSYETKYLGHEDSSIKTSKGVFSATHFINCAGLYADRVAHDFGFGEKYTMLPFIGFYYYAPKLKGTFQRHIYPTPDPRNPFLGVHVTVTVDGSVKVGPTAVPLLSREQYGLLQGFNLSDFFDIAKTYPRFAKSSHHDVFSLIKSEVPKVFKSRIVNQAQKLVPSLRTSDFTLPGKPGIRAQLFDKEAAKLEMDFVVEGDANSTHVLNAVSPAWTSCISFARFVVDKMTAQGAI